MEQHNLKKARKDQVNSRGHMFHTSTLQVLYYCVAVIDINHYILNIPKPTNKVGL